MRKIDPERIRDVVVQLYIQIKHQLPKRIPPSIVAIDTEGKSLFRRE